MKIDREQLAELLRPYNPWWQTGATWTRELPEYQRPIVNEVLADLGALPQIISITGPRRVGKSTAVKQIIKHLIQTEKINPERVLYFSFDDPELFANEGYQRTIFDTLVERFVPLGSPLYFFLDEIQRLPRWELYLKKAYDLKRPIRFIVSGSASSPIFRGSQESLLGRVKDRHLLPFSFREYCSYRMLKTPAFKQVLSEHCNLRPALLAGDGPGAVKCATELARALEPYSEAISAAVIDFCREGGFPEVWALADPIRKIDYLMEQQVRKVLYEDLMMLTQYRKPENVLRFFVYLLAHPGVEINTTKISAEIDVERRVIDENLPRLEMTDLIIRIGRFSAQPTRVRKGNFKCYPVDPALRNAVLKTWTPPDETMMGYYAENLILRELAVWHEKLELSYYRDRDREVDFVLTHGGNLHLPFEIRSQGDSRKLEALGQFVEKFGCDLGVVVTRGQKPKFEEYAYLPLRFMLLGT